MSWWIASTRPKKPRTNMDLLEKFNNRLPDQLPEDECWEWQGCKDKGGYGILHHGKKLRAHRVSYEIHYAESLSDLHCLHRCDNPSCVNPFHLFSGTNTDNMNDKVMKGRAYTGNQQGQNNGNSKLSDDVVKEIRLLYNTGGYTTIQLGEKYGVNLSTISYIVNNKTYKHLLE